MTEYILSQIFSIFNQKNLVSIIHYGNRKGRDIDLLVIVKGQAGYDCNRQRELDIISIGDYWLAEMIKGFDPLITEPVLTGQVIYGQIDSISHRLRNSFSSSETVSYLNQKAAQFFDWAKVYLEANNLKEAANCLRFSLSFCYFANYYKVPQKPITFSQLFSWKKSNLIDLAEKIAKNDIFHSRSDLFYLIKENRKMLP